jgi:hypothetical protein
MKVLEFIRKSQLVLAVEASAVRVPSGFAKAKAVADNLGVSLVRGTFPASTDSTNRN